MEVEMGPNILFLEVIKLSLVSLSLLVGLIWSVTTKDVQSGFTIAGSLAMFFLVGVTTIQHTASDTPYNPCEGNSMAAV